MGKGSVLFSIALAIFIAFLSLTLFGDNNVPELPDFYWGKKGDGSKDDKSIRPFQIKVEEKVLEDLRKRLKLETSPEGNRLTEPIAGQGFQYGFNSNYLKKVGDYWLNKYDWRAREKLLNKHPQFKTTIAGLDIHYVHIKSANNAKYNVTRPLLLLHGWPGSFVELQKIIPLLTDPKEDNINFELVIPSIPGFGFSEAPSKPGFGPVEASQLFLKLMHRIGYERFYVQGGDWGAIIATSMAALYHTNVISIHVNLCISQHPRFFLRYIAYSLFFPLFYSSEETARLLPPTKPLINLWEHSGYLHFQATKPDTIGPALSNSPLGLASYILEKFGVWTHSENVKKEDGGLSESFTLDELLDNVMIYWVTNSIGTSMRLYKEALSDRQAAYGMTKVPTYVPSACQTSPHEYLGQAEALLVDKYPQLMSYSNGFDGSVQAEDLEFFFTK
ncbi:unnamed protein product [Allacma fusca]|uniref:Epoxide hydrolase n=1 Tax=Allacma fusca TaxID=39272 RepID=A0A8J2MD88_9HEXA|nr:unnamed protein product [Allacma fusca]